MHGVCVRTHVRVIGVRRSALASAQTSIQDMMESAAYMARARVYGAACRAARVIASESVGEINMRRSAVGDGQ